MLPSEWKRKKAEELNKPVVHKKIANTFIENVLHDKTLSAIKITYYIATILKDFDYSKDLNTLIIDTKEMLKYTNLTMTDITNNLKKLQKTSISYIEKDNFEEYISLIPRFKIHLGRKRRIEIDMYSKIAKQLLDVVDNYTFIDTSELMKLKKIHSIRLLPILNMINGYDVKQKTYILSDLNSIFETEYKKLYDIEKNVLKKAKEELDNNSTLTFEYTMNFESLGVGRSRIVSVTIKPVSKNNYQSTIFTNFDQPATSKNKTEQTQKKVEKKVNIADVINACEEYIEEQKRYYKNEEEKRKLVEYLTARESEFLDFVEKENKLYRDYKISFGRHIENYEKYN